MRTLSCGILAHVDAGKTTLSEALLYTSGALRTLGRVDHGDAFLDTADIERERGITVFSKLAIMTLPGVELTLVDTPGHVDFSAETERALSVMDMAILVVSATDGVQAHTRTLWGLLEKYRVPTFIFVNKTDLPGLSRGELMTALTSRLSGGCAELNSPNIAEEAATCDEGALSEYLSTGAVADTTLRRLIAERKLFPVLFGSALKLTGVEELISAIERCAPDPPRGADFAAEVYKIARDSRGERLTYLRLTGGELRVKDSVEIDGISEKIAQIRLYSGAKYTQADFAPAGTICAVTGLTRTRAGMRLGAASGAETWTLEPVLSCEVLLPEGGDKHTALSRFRALEEEDPTLRVEWNERLGEVRVRLMGNVQGEVLKKLYFERYHEEISFGAGGIVYRETIRNTVEGVGHFEPLRHYAEVHLILSPLDRGSGLIFESDVPTDDLDINWQRLILTHLEEKTHLGVLTGSPITDVKITLAAGRASLKHTEGGDFREATYRAVRQGLMQAKCLLLEPWYDFRLEIPAKSVGRAVSDLARMSARTDATDSDGVTAVLTGSVPVAEIADYHNDVASYTHGLGSLTLTLRGYEECHDADRVIARANYDAEADLENTPDSVFCAHGAGYTVRWFDVPQYMHLESAMSPERVTYEPEVHRSSARALPAGEAGDRELRAIFERTYGDIKRRDLVPNEERKKYEPKTELKPGPREIREQKQGPEYLLVDGYNIIFAWDELRKLGDSDIDVARKALMDSLASYAGLRGCELILVFDAYKVAGGRGSVERYNGIDVVYTKEAQTADTYIEKTAHDLSRHHKVRVATSDGSEQMIILGSGALRVTAQELLAEINRSQREIAAKSATTPVQPNRPLAEKLKDWEG